MLKRPQEVPVNAEIIAAKDVIVAFLTSLKNYDLYPPGHTFSQNFLTSTYGRLNNFLSRYGEFKFSIEPKRLLYKEVPIYETQSGEDNFAFLYRDGLLWIEFHSGLTLEETKTFLTILNKFKVLHDEPEDDIVTALWDENMAHIKYEAKELFTEDVPLLDFSRLNQISVNRIAAESDPGESSAAGPEEPDNILDLLPEEGHHQWWSFSPEEIETLREMVREAEQSVRNSDVLQVLFFVLTKQDIAEDFGVVLDSLKFEWRTEIEHGNLARVVHHLTILKTLKESPQSGREWVTELLASFFANISAEGFLSSLEKGLAHLNGNNPAELHIFRKFLRLLETNALSSLCSLVPQIKAQEVRDVLFAGMVHLGKRDLTPLKNLLDHENDLIALIATQVLSKTKSAEAAKLLANALQHSSSRVRRFALRAYLKVETPCVGEIFTIIDDPDVTTRAIFLDFLGRERDEKVEKLLLNYLEREPHQGVDEDHVHKCFMALGRCGSRHSLPFLKKTLLDQSWKLILKTGQTAHQQGAILALSRLQVREATEVLKQGAASLVPVIRKSCRTALTQMSQ